MEGRGANTKKATCTLPTARKLARSARVRLSKRPSPTSRKRLNSTWKSFPQTAPVARWSPSSRHAMPRLPRVSGAEAIRALERLGFAQVRQCGIHVILKRVGPDRSEEHTSELQSLRHLV